MTLGVAERQGDLLDEVTRHCDEAVPEGSVYALLHRERDNLFPDGMFADLFTSTGRRSVPPSIVATVMVLQKLGGLSDREACERFAFDVRWRYACGLGGWDAGQRASFAHTVLVDMRARLRDSNDPKRVFRATTDLAADAGLLGVKRALDSAPLFDAVATQDTVTLIRSAIRGLLRAAPAALAAAIRAALVRHDDYTAAGKPPCDWDDAAARELLVDELVGDGLAALGVVEQATTADPAVGEAAALLATVVGQDVEEGDDGVFRIARRVARDRVISTVDPDARHGHKTSARRYDGYKGHVAVDPDSEIITQTAVTPANVGDAEATQTLLAEFVAPSATTHDAAPAATTDDHDPPNNDHDPTNTGTPHADDDPAADTPDDSHDAAGDPDDGDDGAAGDGEGGGPRVYGDAAYGSGDNLEALRKMGATAMTKVAPATAPGGRFSKDRFDVDLQAGTVTCPAGQTVGLKVAANGNGTATFGGLCADCPLRAQCTASPAGRSVNVGPHEALLAAARARQADPDWQADYRANRPKVERKLAHLVRRGHGGRRARVRGRQRVAQDWDWNAAAHNIARLAMLGVRRNTTGWQAATA
ncbi:MAG TPA: transposase [Egibacteraceae bacterium]|nr:transposase [Egibacteraceae bacterium]